VTTSRSSLLALALFFTALSSTACGARSRQDEPTLRIRGERALHCDALLTELQSIPTDTATEVELQRAMELADTSAGPCRDAFVAEAINDVERVLASHLARQFAVQARALELALSTRFDANRYLCPIIGEAFETLLLDISELEQLLVRTDLIRDDRLLLEGLLELDLSTIDMLVATADGRCVE
jgi:hypothetical protein